MLFVVYNAQSDLLDRYMASHGMTDNVRAFTEWFSSHGGMLHPDVSFEPGKLTSDSHHGGFRSSKFLQRLPDIQL